LVIGANGRLGRACISALLASSHVPIALVRDKSTFPTDLAERCGGVVETDARVAENIAEALRTHRCDGVIQAGGYTPFWVWETSELPLVFAATLDAAEMVGRERTVSQQGGCDGDGDGDGDEDGILPEKRIRAWMICDLGMMDCPWSETLLWH